MPHTEERRYCEDEEWEIDDSLLETHMDLSDALNIEGEVFSPSNLLDARLSPASVISGISTPETAAESDSSSLSGEPLRKGIQTEMVQDNLRYLKSSFEILDSNSNTSKTIPYIPYKLD